MQNEGYGSQSKHSQIERFWQFTREKETKGQYEPTKVTLESEAKSPAKSNET